MTFDFIDPRRLGWLVAAATAALVFATAASAADEVDAASGQQQVLTLKASRLASEGRCVEALPEIERARAIAPEDASLARFEGQCRLQVYDYAAAFESLEEARRLDPELQDVDLYLAIAHYHLEDFVAAQRSIDAAKGNVSGEGMAQYELYSGLLLLDRRETREGALALERARMADASQVEPVASYYAGLAWQSLSERDLAREAFERVIDVDPDGVWGKRAEIALDSEGMEERNWARLDAGLDYDSNVLLLGEGLPLPVAITGQDDGRFSWFLEGGAELFRSGRWSGGVRGSYAGGVNFNLHEFDTQYPIASVWLDRGLGERSLLRLTYGLGHAWVDYSPFVTRQSALLTLFHNWGRPGRSEIGLGWDWNNYHFTVPASPVSQPDGSCNAQLLPCSPFPVFTREARDRDGNGLMAGLLHRYELQAIEGDVFRTFTLRGGYSFRRYWADGTDWDSMGHSLLLGVDTHLPWKLFLDLSAAFTYRPFDNPSSYPQPPLIRGETYFPLSGRPSRQALEGVGPFSRGRSPSGPRSVSGTTTCATSPTSRSSTSTGT